MANGTCVVNNGRKIVMHRSFDAISTISAPTVFSVGTGTTTPTNADTALGNRITIAGNNTKAISTGYPQYDESNFIITNRCVLATTDCNGNTISEFGLYNTDGTPLLYNHSVFTGIVKTTSVQIVFSEKDKII